MDLVFEWDSPKAKRNLQKQGITLDEAITVFDDAFASIFMDHDHSGAEEREIIVGYSILNRLLVVCFTERSKNRVRIISARNATAPNAMNMKNTSRVKFKKQFDYSKALPNRFAGKRGSRSVVVLLDSDVATVFKDAESVNAALRALLAAVPAAGNKRRRA